MTLVETIIREADDTVHRYIPHMATVKQHGVKRPDTAKFVFPVSARVKLQDEITYVQDIVSVSYLRAIWNFQLSLRDERGFNLDGNDLSESNYVRPIIRGEKFSRQYSLLINNSSISPNIPNSAEMRKRIKLNKQFDIFVWCTPFTTTGSNSVVFNKISSSAGIELGFTSVGTSGRVYVRLRSGGSTTTYTGTTIPTPSNGNDLNSARNQYLIRCWRGSDDVVHVSVNGQEDITKEYDDNIDNTASIKFGYGSARTFRGLIHQVRVYTGANVTQSEADRIYVSKPQISTMKFGGIVINANDSTAKKTITCRSFSTLLFNKHLDENLYGLYDLATGVTPTIRTGNRYASTTSLQAVIEDMLTTIQADVVLKTKENISASLAADPTEIIGVGSIVAFLKIVLPSAQTTFHVTPRKLLIIETVDPISSSGYIFEQDSAKRVKYKITESEGRNFDAASEVLVIGHNNVTGYSRDDITDPNKSLTVYAPQIVEVNALSIIAQRIANQIGDNVNRYVIEAPVLMNNIQPLQRVQVINTIKDLNTTTTIAEIEYMYPKGKTIIHAGINPVDYYNLEDENSGQVVGLSNSYVTNDEMVVTPNSIPIITITLPAEGEIGNFTFSGVAFDSEDGDIRSRLVWTSSIDGSLGTGAQITASLSAGNHLITATATDDDGGVGTATRNFTVTDSRPPTAGSISFTFGENAIALDWSNVSGATNYRVERAINGNDDDDFTTLTTVTNSAHIDRNFSTSNSNDTFYYRIVAINSLIEADPGPVLTVQLPTRPALTTTYGGFSDVAGTVALPIDFNSTIDSIRVETSTDNGQSFVIGISHLMVGETFFRNLLLSDGYSASVLPILPNRVYFRATGTSGVRIFLRVSVRKNPFFYDQYTTNVVLD